MRVFMTFRSQKQTSTVFGHTFYAVNLHVLIFHLVNSLCNWPRRRVTRVVFKNFVITSLESCRIVFPMSLLLFQNVDLPSLSKQCSCPFPDFLFQCSRWWDDNDLLTTDASASHSTLLLPTREGSDSFPNPISSPLIWQHLWGSQFIDSPLRAYHLVCLNSSSFWTIFDKRDKFRDKNVRYPLHSRWWCGCP